MEPGIARLQRLQVLDDLLGRAAHTPPEAIASSMRGSLALGARRGSRMISICSSVKGLPLSLPSTSGVPHPTTCGRLFRAG
jgi:hypothetical protein